MRLRASFLLILLVAGFTAFSLASAQGKAAAAKATLPPFSGTWTLNLKRSKIEGDKPIGVNQAVIEYDGKTWHYIHTHRNRYDQLSDTWQVTLVVGSPVYHVEQEEPLTFRSRIFRQGDAMVMLEHVKTDRGQRTTNMFRYTLEDGGNTLVEVDKVKGPLGTETNRYVLEREGSGANTVHGEN
jgi:hypothetical protein